MDLEEKFALLKRNTQELVKEDELKEILKKKNPGAYIGFAPTGRIHIGYMIPLYKIRDFIALGFKFTFLIADLHAYLDDEKTPWELLDQRYEYYKLAITALLKSFDVDTTKIEFVKGTDFQFKRDYIINVFKMVGDVTLNRSKRAASEVVRFKEDPKLGGFIYPLLQIEDAKALQADVTFGGIDQRGIYMLGRELLDAFGREKYSCVFTPLLPGITGAKMSASDPNSKIDILDDEKTVIAKINKAQCVEGDSNNGVVAFCEYVLLPFLTDNGKSLRVERPEKFGGTVEYASIAALKADFDAKKLHPADLKKAVAQEINLLLNPVRKTFEKHADLIKRAYP
ncbi:tyrosine--tRNA ligase [Candidatus Woesearchaeota archaeon]|nr:MAG: tyrosine--tRNA ligase [Candidatus Woesearchaeota archaeon]